MSRAQHWKIGQLMMELRDKDAQLAKVATEFADAQESNIHLSTELEEVRGEASWAQDRLYEERAQARMVEERRAAEIEASKPLRKMLTNDELRAKLGDWPRA